jgi:hypothetical protein
MPWGAAAAAGATIVGGMMSADASKSAANTSADAQRYAADQAAAAAKFNPIGVTTRFGNSFFNRSSNPTQDFNTWAQSQGYNLNPVTDENGNVTQPSLTPEQIQALQTRYQAEVPRTQGDITSQGYTLSPELKAIQDRVMAGASAYNPDQYGVASQNLFNLGQGYLATSPQQAATDYYNQQRQLLMPGREQALSQVQNQQFQTGRSGLGVGGTSSGYTVGGPGLMQSNPQLAALYNAQSQQDATLAASADQYGQQRTNFGLSLMNAAPGLFTTGYGPLQTQLGLSSTIEQLGQSPLDISAQLAGKSATAGANVGQSLLQGGLSAAKTQQIGNQYSFPGAALQGLGSNTALNSWFQNSLTQKPTTGQTTNWFGGVINDPTYGAGTAYNNMTPGEISNMQQNGL